MAESGSLLTAISTVAATICLPGGQPKSRRASWQSHSPGRQAGKLWRCQVGTPLTSRDARDSQAVAVQVALLVRARVRVRVRDRLRVRVRARVM